MEWDHEGTKHTKSDSCVGDGLQTVPRISEGHDSMSVLVLAGAGAWLSSRPTVTAARSMNHDSKHLRPLNRAATAPPSVALTTCAVHRCFP